MLSRLAHMFRKLFQVPGGGGDFLCDTCKYDFGSACKRPERPNARRCPDYKRGK